MSHIWWDCRELRSFWQGVLSTIREVTGTQVPETAEATLLYMFSMPIHTYKRSLLRHLLQAAKTVIPRKWKTTDPPTVEDWHEEIELTRRMEELVASTPEDTERFINTWGSWDEFRLYLGRG